jgi:hypothetical protein
MPVMDTGNVLLDGWRATKHAQHGVSEKKKKKKKRSQSEREEKRRRANE